jgi:hypothetical protein
MDMGTAGAANKGFFGATSNGAAIRDLTLIIANTGLVGNNHSEQFTGGLVGYAKNTTIINVKIEVPDGKVLGAFRQEGYTSYTGGIVGLAEDTKIDNCRFITTGSGALWQKSNSSGGVVLGGIVGRAAGTTEIFNCSVAGKAFLNPTGSDVAGSSVSFYLGGIAGSMADAVRIGNCESDLALNVERLSGTGGYGGVGGIVGSGSGTGSQIWNTHVRGDITCNTISGLTVGGLFATAGAGIVESCSYSGGVIDVRTSGTILLGGAVGSTSGTIKDCYAAAAEIILTLVSTSGTFGGFAGSIGSGTLENCYSVNPITIDGSNGNNGEMLVGGFAGTNSASLTGCYATGSITTVSKGEQKVGGLLGRSSSDTVIKQCYATGAVNVTALDSGSIYAGGLIGHAISTNISECYAAGAVSAHGDWDTREMCAGGLVGYLSSTGNITNCYALGDVFVDSIMVTGAAGTWPIITYAGGLVGYVYNSSYGANVYFSISRSFAAGAVVAQSSDTGGTSSVIVGGILGAGTYWHYNGTLNGYVQSSLFNCAALGPSVTAKGGATAWYTDTRRKAGRVFGDLLNTGSGASTNAVINKNYGLDEMRIENNSSYTAIYTTPTYDSGSNDASAHGATVSASTFRNSGFWSSSSYLGFSSTYWNFSTTAGRRYPVLRNVVNAGAQ